MDYDPPGSEPPQEPGPGTARFHGMTESITYPGANGLWESAASPLGEPEMALEDAIDLRVALLTEWLKENAPDSREGLASLDEEKREHIFWHHGYLVALRAVRNFIRHRRRVLH